MSHEKLYTNVMWFFCYTDMYLFNNIFLFVKSTGKNETTGILISLHEAN